MSIWKATQYKGIRYREHETRKIGRVQKDKYYSVRYRANGKLTETGLGWLSEGVTLDVAIEKLRLFKSNAKAGDGARTSTEQQLQNSQIALKTITVKDFIQQHYRPYAETMKPLEMKKKEGEHLKVWIVPILGDLMVKDINVESLSKLKVAMEQAGRRGKMISIVLSTCGCVFRLAQEKGIIGNDVQFPKKQLRVKYCNQRQRFLTRQEAEALLELVRKRNPVLADVGEFCLMTACRKGEAFKLTWQDIDLASASALIRDAKNGSDRFLYLNDRAVEIIRRQPMGKPHDCVFLDRGNPFEVLPWAWKAALKESGLNDGITDPRLTVCFHTLRHSAASWLVQSGVDLYKVSKVLGHKNLSMTQRYAHLNEDSIRNAVQGLSI